MTRFTYPSVLRMAAMWTSEVPVSAVNGAAVSLQPYRGRTNQQWLVEKGSFFPEGDLPDSTYKVESLAVIPSGLFHVGGLKTNNGGPIHVVRTGAGSNPWIFTKNENGSYYMKIKVIWPQLTDPWFVSYPLDKKGSMLEGNGAPRVWKPFPNGSYKDQFYLTTPGGHVAECDIVNQASLGSDSRGFRLAERVDGSLAQLFRFVKFA